MRGNAHIGYEKARTGLIKGFCRVTSSSYKVTNQCLKAVEHKVITDLQLKFATKMSVCSSPPSSVKILPEMPSFLLPFLLTVLLYNEYYAQ